MADQQPSNHELSLSAEVFTIFLCVLFGSNAVAIKIAFSGLGVFQAIGWAEHRSAAEKYPKGRR